MIENKTIKEYLSELGSKNPTPGGGSTAALVGVFSATLGEMVCNTTLRKREDKEVDVYLEELKKLQNELNNLIEADMNAYQKVIAAYKGGNKEEINKSLVHATKVPLAIMNKSIEVLKVLNNLVQLINYTALGEIGVAIMLAESVLESAGLIVEINLSKFVNDQFYEKGKKQVKEYLMLGKRIKKKAIAKLYQCQQEGE
ncbi:MULTISPECIES: cyclodeaminase/cyclohydrolase family protein [unclassified Candidatus Frackibacter]|uniref:cyclodeaminase/cyclohydrolase family protein n=1 Tax=unclassified Candidatus Frackibacter TaxID=2648818 RepID=UPI000891AEB1|nr:MULTISPECIES: cyclodeaminase/cyclohydrolase family protein [unclassified Candidatus Frackibacter]SDC11827.1 Formiminotetrahydrofolate cyclodeaminase [Candidatus Frackibacter sp. WG11]SEM36235.1 Formiminotetrahydrofolate cyclodeaminase [Candidatus Frackibacter sp. WG12]SFL41476.1 Formiminotetrahydrofolate cyclodeaminase [Candidatus Frackibacter sp. WG13]